jgi:dynein light chain Tctex-type 1
MVSPFSAVQDQVRDIVREIVAQNLADKDYRAELVRRWSDDLLRDILRPLGQEQFQPFKYVATCLLMSNQPNGLYSLTHSL